MAGNLAGRQGEVGDGRYGKRPGYTPGRSTQPEPATMKSGAAHYPKAAAPGSYKNLTKDGRARCSSYSVLAY